MKTNVLGPKAADSCKVNLSFRVKSDNYTLALRISTHTALVKRYWNG